MGSASGSPEFKVPPSSGRFISSLLCTHATVLLDPGGTFDPRLFIGPSGAGFSILLLDLPPLLYNYGAISSFRRMRTALWPVCFPVYASSMLFRQPSDLLVLRSFVGNAVPPAIFPDLANINATLGSDYWLGFITTGLSPDKKRLALLGAQRGAVSWNEVAERRNGIDTSDLSVPSMGTM